MADTRTITIVIDRALDDELGQLARSTGRDKQSLANEALTAWLEDQEDIRVLEPYSPGAIPRDPSTMSGRRLAWRVEVEPSRWQR